MQLVSEDNSFPTLDSSPAPTFDHYSGHARITVFAGSSNARTYNFGVSTQQSHLSWRWRRKVEGVSTSKDDPSHAPHLFIFRSLETSDT